MFGQTCTASGDSMRQYEWRKNADPKKWVVMDIECDAGCGVVPFRYRDKSYVNALQWAIGLETFLLCEDPWRIFLTTDHPNGAPFYTYPHLIRLLMDRGFRDETMQRINPGRAASTSTLPIARARVFALRDRHPDPRRAGAQPRPQGSRPSRPRRLGDITVYKDDANREAMFTTPELVFKNGELIVRDGKVVKVVNGATHVARPEYDRSIEKPLKDYFDRYHTVRMENFRSRDDEIIDGGRGEIVVQPVRPQVS